MGWAQLTVHTEDEGSVRYSVSMRADRETWAHCCRYEDQAPIMIVDGAPGVHVAITSQEQTRVTRGELEFARALAREAARYADECERFYAPDDTTGEGSAENVA